jgi:hypothetical protein
VFLVLAFVACNVALYAESQKMLQRDFLDFLSLNGDNVVVNHNNIINGDVLRPFNMFVGSFLIQYFLMPPIMVNNRAEITNNIVKDHINNVYFIRIKQILLILSIGAAPLEH